MPSEAIDFRDHSVADLAAAVHSRARSARELTEAALARIDALDGELNAFVTVDREAALAQANDVDARLLAGDGVGPLAGIPLAVKDLEDAAGLPTRYGSRLSSPEPVEGDSVLVARLRAAGCVVIGKTTTPEYGHKGVTDCGLTGTTRNPWSLDRSPGGSSGGSAAALAAGLVPLATGSDGGGSIRIPAALCGLAGLKTTQGRVPNGGPTPPGSGLFTVKGPMAVRSSDVGFALDVCLGPHPTDPFSLPRSGSPWFDAVSSSRLPARVAWSPTLGFADVDDEIAAVCRRAIDRLADAGVEVVELPSVWSVDPVLPWLTNWVSMRARSQGHLVDSPDWEHIDQSLRTQIEMGLGMTAVQLAQAQDAIFEYNLQLEAAFEQAPILLTPACAGQTPRIGPDGAANGTVNGVETPAWVGFTYGFNMTRNPVGSVPAGLTDDGMPVGMQIVGRQLCDVAVLQTMTALEEFWALGRSAPFGR